MIEAGHFQKFFYTTEQRFLARIETSDKKIYNSLKDYSSENTKISAMLIQNCKNVFLVFFSLNLFYFLLFVCSLLLKKIREAYKLRNISFKKTKKRKKKVSIRTSSSVSSLFPPIQLEALDSRYFYLLVLKDSQKTEFNHTRFLQNYQM